MIKQVYSTTHFRKILSALLALFLIISAFTPSVYADDLNTSGMVDSGIDYTDSHETVMVGGNARDTLYTNPYRGFHVWAQPGVLKLTNSEKNAAVNPSSTSHSLIYFPVELSDFSGAYHTTEEGTRGEDAELTTSALNALDETLKNIRNNNNQVILRFVYDKGNNGIEDGEGCEIPDKEVVVPKDWLNYNRVVEPRQDMIMHHIEQLAPLLVENQDAIYTVQVGFYGGYGELHSTGACSDKYIAAALDKMLEETKGSNLRISARTPRRYAYYRFENTNINNLINDITRASEDAYRIAIFNDGYLSNGNDYGTYENREIETNWMAAQNLHNPYGGDAIPKPGGEEVGYPAKQPFVIDEMFKVHTSYISADDLLVNYWKNTPYDKTEYANPDAEYEGATLYQYIDNHLGYRFVLRDSKLSESVKKGGTLKSEFKIENVGFGNLFYPMKSYAYIADENGKVVVGPTQVNVDPTSFQINTVKDCSINLDLPADIEPGEYKLYLQFKIGDRVVNGATKPYGAIRLANKDIWNEKLEANYLGSFTVDRDVKITKKWEDGSHADARPDSLTFTVEKVPDKYQRVQYIEADGTQYIDTGVKADAVHTIYSDGYSHDANANHLLQVYESSDTRLGAKLYGGSNRLQYYWVCSKDGAASKTINSDELGGIDLRSRFKITQNASGLQLVQGDKTKTIEYVGIISGTLDTTWKIFYYNNNNDQLPRGFLCEAKILNGDTLLHHYVPCYRKSDDEIGVYDLVDKRFLTNAGTGTFGKGEDISNEVIVEEVDANPQTITVSKDKWTINGDTWETSIVVEIVKGIISIFEENIPHYESDATVQDKKIIDEDDSVEITNSLKEEEWNEGVVTQEPTCTENGIKTFTCKTGCNHTMTEEIPALGHQWNDGETTKEASYTAEGEKLYTCTVCSSTKTEIIPKLVYPAGTDPNQKGADGTAIGKGASAVAADKAITSSTSDEGPAGSKYALLALRSKSQGNNIINLAWNRVGGAAKYVVYGNACGRANRMKHLTTTGGLAFNVRQINATLRKGTYHKFMVVALDSNNNVITTSKVIHVATKGGKVKNPQKVTAKKPKAVKVGNTVKLKAKQKGKKVKKHRGICYESSNPSIATVNGKGKVTGKRKGTCYIYAYAQNGIYKKTKITVK